MTAAPCPAQRQTLTSRSSRRPTRASGLSPPGRVLFKSAPIRMPSMPSMPPPPDTITIHRPDDWHVHFRDGAMLRQVLPYTARQFARAIVMPNLVPPVTDIAAARAYRERILAALPPPPFPPPQAAEDQGGGFTPLMTCYLTDTTDPTEVARGQEEGVFAAVKLYPAHATTHSAHGVTDM